MKIRNRNAAAEKIEMQMSSMIDVVFQLLIFFMLTLKIVEAEGDFNINMPLGRPSESSSIDAELPPITVRLIADANGELAELRFNKQTIPGGSGAFDQLNQKIGDTVNRLIAAGPSNVDKQEVIIDPDYNLNYGYIMSAISACSGRLENGQVTPYIRRIKFAQIRPEPGE